MDLRDIRVCVIVPVYQSAAYLPACLDAILAQTCLLYTSSARR